MNSHNGSLEWYNEQFSDIASTLEGEFDIPVLDRTGTTQRFDMTMDWSPGDTNAIRAAVLQQLGLELIPARETLEMLVVEHIP